MNVSEAKEYMENEVRCINRASHCDRKCVSCELVKEEKPLLEAFSIAIKSLEMQIPKKPIYSDFDDNGNDEIIPYKAVCPVCGCEFEFGTWNDEENHHCICGQKIDWEGGAE